MNLFFYVQHLLGIGHLVRTAAIAREAARAGHEVTVVSGGVPVPGVDFGGASVMQLPPARVEDRRFSELLDEHGAPVDDAWRAARRDRLLKLCRAARPDVVLTELYPFGRRQLGFELRPLLAQCAEDRARAGRPRIACSVRDILVASPKPERIREALELALEYYDLVLVHGDPSLIPFDETFPPAPELGARLAYTGYVVNETTPQETGQDANRDGEGEVIVSAGGGAIGGRLLATALDARPRSALADARWRLLAGPNLPEAEFRALAARAAGEGAVCERFRPDFRALLPRARLSISQGGYNTLTEVLSAGLPAVVMPYAHGLETEQTLRARLLADRGLVEMIDEDDLDANTLAAAIDRALAAPRSGAGIAGLDLAGAPNTVRLLERLADSGYTIGHTAAGAAGGANE